MRTQAATEALAEKSGEVSRMLKSIGNEQRLIILCQLAGDDELSVSALADAVDLSQSALSQHLARMRADGVLATRREGQIIHYRILDARVRELMSVLYRLYCAVD